MDSAAEGEQMTVTTPDYLLVDADAHFREPEDCFTRHIDPRYRDHAVTLVPLKNHDGPEKRGWACDGRMMSFSPFYVSDRSWAPGARLGLFSGAKGYDEVQQANVIDSHDFPDMMHRAERIRTLDVQRVQATVMLPTDGVCVQPDLQNRPDVLGANLTSFNRWVEEEWGFGADNGRIFSAACLALYDLEWALSELDRTIASGCQVIYLQCGPVAGRSLADPHFDPFWARVEEAKVKPVFHVGALGYDQWFSTQWGEPSGLSLRNWSPFQYYACMMERPIQDTIADLLLHNLFGRFPDLVVLSIELGSTWVAPLLMVLDKAAKLGNYDRWWGPKPVTLPSEIFRNHVYVSPFYEDDLGALVDLIGADRVMFGSDWPHGEGVAAPLEWVQRLDEFKISAADQRLILRDNAARLLGLG